jgi:predicted dehydrogenase
MKSKWSPKWGIIGCGGISRFHFAGLEKLSSDIVYIADLNAEAAAPYVSKFNAKYTADYQSLIADPEVTVVSVLTNSKYHREMCMAALGAGKDVVCEKTMSENASEAAEIVNAVKDSNRLFFTAFMKRFFPAVQKARALIPSLGRLFSAQIRTYQPWGNYYEMDAADIPSWVFDKYGGAVMKCAASHLLDLTFSLLGRPISLYAHVDYIPSSNFDRKVTALFEYPEGMIASFEAAVHPLKRIGYERNAWDEHIQINGVDGRLDLYIVQWDYPEHNPALLIHYDNTTETATEYRFPAINPFDIEIAAYHQALSNRQQIHPDVVDGFNVDYVIEMMAKSHEAKIPIKLDWMGV